MHQPDLFDEPIPPPSRSCLVQKNAARLGLTIGEGVDGQTNLDVWHGKRFLGVIGDLSGDQIILKLNPGDSISIPLELLELAPHATITVYRGDKVMWQKVRILKPYVESGKAIADAYFYTHDLKSGEQTSAGI